MNESYLAIASAIWLGILTSISPCPLATNIAAVTFVSRKVGSVPKVLVAGLFYTLGRMFAYSILGIILLQGVFAAPAVSHLLQKYLNLVMGPLLILVAMVLLKLISLPMTSNAIAEKLYDKMARVGIGGAGVLGLFFALSFCPTSAALFFGSLLPLAVKFDSLILLPSIYGVATGLPVLIFAFLLAFGAHKIGKAYSKIAVFEKWAQQITGVVFLAIGIYFTVKVTLAINI